ncbi:formimidoyltransferase-cyclodeaminase-like [Paramacrobiotus metropolitanus]|uniref:formimidoyltransferase-cyclodeaminase-like n=1 Tax=Paramacrobiotus metropolitanus TaxID=2943436 RepID=UPI002445FC5A|nr:formimidoyltransferase-cyclodeaminase-like [Paramacrobiotus metropolitanus]
MLLSLHTLSTIFTQPTAYIPLRTIVTRPLLLDIQRKMAQIIECVPNFSEGRRPDVIEAISKAVRSVPGVSLLDVDPGKSTNRTVYTFVGNAENVVEAALAAAKVAYTLIDMTKHSGEHPRLGALDVCPFIPVANSTMEDCVECANRFAKRLGEDLNVPVYMYGFASDRDYRKQVPQIRAGEYEGLAEKLKKPEWTPDFGPTTFVPRWGATIAGARKFLAAYNINLLSTKEQAHRIALNIREQGRGPKEPGRLKSVQGLGWWYEEGKIAQISTNLTDLDVTTLHEVYEAALHDAGELKLPVIGSELVGLIPLKPILQAADYFIEKENLFVLEEEQKVQLAVNRLGLNTLSRFDYKTRIIEYAVDNSKNESPLLYLTVKEFVNEVAARKPAPGGGSVAALIGSMGAGLCRMVGLLTHGNKKFEAMETDMRRLTPVFHVAMNRLLLLVDQDTKAFNSILEANRLPATSPEEKTAKEQAIQRATMEAINVPMETAKAANSVWRAMEELAALANITAISDLQVGAKSIETAVAGAVWNIHINLSGLTDAAAKEHIAAEADAQLKYSQTQFWRVCDMVEKRKKIV